MKEIENREDISKLVNTFYTKVRADETLESVFNSHLIEEKWPGHLMKMTDFWASGLFGTNSFKGEPIKAHIQVDKTVNFGITQEHFAQWIRLWFQTIDEMFEGSISQKAKDIARMMTTQIFLEIWKQRPTNEL